MTKPLAATCLLALMASVAPAQADRPTTLDQAAAEALLAEVRAARAPDRRTVVFDVEVAATADAVTLTGTVHDAALERALLDRFTAASRAKVVDQLRALPDRELGDRTFGVVCVSVANLRSKPGHSQELGTQALLGMPLRLLQRDGGWYYVQAPNGYLCWTRDRMQRMTADEFAAWRERDKVVVTATFSHVRREPSRDAAPVSDVVAGGLLALLGERDDYYHVQYADGREGYLEKRDGRPFAAWLADADDAPDRVVATARRFFGVPYLWGGTSTKGMDCSGFTSTVYLLNGVLLPRDASQQVHAGVAVPFEDGFDEVQPGDLLFFGRRATAGRRERVTHVGISLGGPRFIHASTDVHENSFAPDDPDYSESLRDSLLHVRRVRGHGPDRLVQPLKSHPLYRPE